MKASELIKELQDRIKMYGDREVQLWDDMYDDPPLLVDVTACNGDAPGSVMIELKFE